MTKFSYKIGYNLSLQPYQYNLLEVNFDKSTIKLHLYLISSRLANF